MLAILTFKSPEDALTPDQVISRLRGEFERVNVDAAEGRARCERMLKTLRSMNAPSEIIELTERSLATTTWVTVTESGLSFGFVLTDEMNIRIDHEEVHDDLIRRCADVLNADLDGCG